jgi:hypothetical protein
MIRNIFTIITTLLLATACTSRKADKTHAINTDAAPRIPTEKEEEEFARTHGYPMVWTMDFGPRTLTRIPREDCEAIKRYEEKLRLNYQQEKEAQQEKKKTPMMSQEEAEYILNNVDPYSKEAMRALRYHAEKEDEAKQLIEK